MSSSQPMPNDEVDCFHVVREIKRAEAYVKSILNGLESEIPHINRSIRCVKTREKALAKVNNKIDIFETLEAICEQALINIRDERKSS